MTKFNRINHEIINWKGSFDKLTKNFTNEDFYLLAYENNWYDDLYVGCAAAFYQCGEWTELLHTYLSDLLNKLIIMGARYDAENVFRLWYEYT